MFVNDDIQILDVCEWWHTVLSILFLSPCFNCSISDNFVIFDGVIISDVVVIYLIKIVCWNGLEHGCNNNFGEF